MKVAPKMFALLFAILVVLAVASTFLINGLIRRGLETAGAYSLGVDVTLSRADLSLTGGELGLSGLTVANPKGFSTDSLIKMERVEAEVRPAALLGDDITIDSIVVESPSLTIEQSMSGTNTKVVLARIQGKKSKSEQEPREATKPGEAKTQKKYRIKTLRITGGNVTFASFLTAKQPITVPLPDIQIEDLSNADGTGLTLARVFERVLLEIIRTALKEGEGTVPASVSNDVIGDIGEFAPNLAGDMIDRAKAALNEASEKLKELFGK